ncbi:MAG TPA: type I DNA topoisomerase [Candidatus Paceibacterota bacterium]|nr:type I DNA topoisomerase [Candidatus Paceibacterota bacterium]HRZ34385.1 type I DNA topoisomerase [Candidatus Paceibacterota bacterium]
MSKKLLIVESPAKAKTIEKYLGKDFVVSSSVGHIRDLPKSNKKAIDIDSGFVPTYEVSPGKEKVISELKKLAKKSDEIYLATDPDREGEAIAWHLKEVLGLKNAQRVTFNEITEEAVKEAVKAPREIDMNLKSAQEARRILDRLVGYDLSGLIWKKVRYGLSAGRVQSPALRIIMEREREIRAFKPEDFWVIRANVKTKETKASLELTCSEEPRELKETEKILSLAKTGKWKVSEIKETKVKRAPKPPFITSTLQQVASTRFGYSPSRTMQIAQKLYEAGFITYMRTDSTNLSQHAIGQIAGAIEKDFGKNLLQIRVYKTKSKSAQEAHEAIRPAKVAIKSAGHNAEQKKIYELIRSRAIASQMKDADVLRTKITAEINDGEIPGFYANGQRIIDEGWLLADPSAKGEEINLPKVKDGEELILQEISSQAKQTEPPSRYTEAGLIKELEKRDIGRPSTYATIMKTLADREYVVKEGKTLIPTDTGDVVSSFLEQNFAKYISDSFTAEMENELDEIAEGRREYVKTLADFYKPFTKEIKEKEDIAKLTMLGEADDKHKCPKCGGKMHIKLGRGGKFLSCDKFPDCSGALTIEGQEIKADEPIGHHPKTGEPIFVKIGRFGPYVQLGENGKDEKGKKVRPKMASIPKDKNLDEVSVEDAVKYLSLPRNLGDHPETREAVVASVGRFGPYIVHNGDFRSLKEDNVYEINLERALQILAEPKKTRRGRGKKPADKNKTAHVQIINKSLDRKLV